MIVQNIGKTIKKTSINTDRNIKLEKTFDNEKKKMLIFTPRGDSI